MVGDIDQEHPSAQNSSDALPTGQQSMAVDDFIEQRVAEVGRVVNQYKHYQDALPPSNKGCYQISELMLEL